MTLGLRKSHVLGLLTLGAMLPAVPASASFSGSYSFGSNLGQLTYTENLLTGTCYVNGYPYRWTSTYYGNFTYISNQGSSQAIPGGTSAVSSSAPKNSDCPQTQTGPTVTYNGTGYTITIQSPFIPNIVVPGYINPKYVVLGVTYAPPGPSSNVDYTNSTLLSNTSSQSKSFIQGYTVTIKLTFGGALLGFANGSQTTTSSTSYTQGSTTSSSVTVSKAVDVSLKVPGPSNPYVGVNHDYDIIWVWLNPIALFTLTNGGGVQWNGYGYSTLDEPGMDVIGVYVGCLNGDLSQTYCNSQYQTPFARAWASIEVWPSGQGPGLTPTDLQNVLATDPYGKCNSTSAIGSSACPSPDPTRFTLTSDQAIQYQQAPPGGQPFTIGYKETYTDTSTQGKSATYTFSQMFGYETTFGGKIFGIGFSATLSATQTLTWTNVWNSQFTSTTSSTAEASITGPPCNVVGSSCSPVYPPSLPTYGQAIGFSLYQDNLYGTFLLIPAQY